MMAFDLSSKGYDCCSQPKRFIRLFNETPQSLEPQHDDSPNHLVVTFVSSSVSSSATLHSFLQWSEDTSQLQDGATILLEQRFSRISEQVFLSIESQVRNWRHGNVQEVKVVSFEGLVQVEFGDARIGFQLLRTWDASLDSLSPLLCHIYSCILHHTLTFDPSKPLEPVSVPGKVSDTGLPPLKRKRKRTVMSASSPIDLRFLYDLMDITCGVMH